MQLHSHKLSIRTGGRGTCDLTDPLQRFVEGTDIQQGLCTVFVHHTSASLIITENADPDVRRDLDGFMARLVPDGDSRFLHRDEGPDDMAAHVRSAMTLTCVQIPITDGRADLGTWQGLYLWEHRTAPHTRRLTLTAVGQ